jgi:adenylate cyclase class 2
MIEVESKVRIKDLDSLRRKIRERYAFLFKKNKIDDYYTLQSEGKYPTKSLRIRHEGKKHIVNFKQRMSYSLGVHAKKETEFEVSDVPGFLALITDFGFRKWLRKEKESEVYIVKKNFTLEINKVKGLGNFLEIEYLCTEKEVKKARKEIYRVRKELGFDKSDVVKGGYTKMLWKKDKT